MPLLARGASLRLISETACVHSTIITDSFPVLFTFLCNPDPLSTKTTLDENYYETSGFASTGYELLSICNALHMTITMPHDPCVVI